MCCCNAVPCITRCKTNTGLSELKKVKTMERTITDLKQETPQVAEQHKTAAGQKDEEIKNLKQENAELKLKELRMSSFAHSTFAAADI